MHSWRVEVGTMRVIEKGQCHRILAINNQDATFLSSRLTPPRSPRKSPVNSNGTIWVRTTELVHARRADGRRPNEVERRNRGGSACEPRGVRRAVRLRPQTDVRRLESEGSQQSGTEGRAEAARTTCTAHLMPFATSACARGCSTIQQ